MKKLISLMCIGFIAVILTACAGSNSKPEARVKCPACGYEFAIEAKG